MLKYKNLNNKGANFLKLEQRLIEPFSKVKYLHVDNFRRYTTIIHYLYLQHAVYYSPPVLPSSILEYIQNSDIFEVFEDYDLSKLEMDLKSLEEWGNIISHPDTGHVTKIEDFNKRKLRYQLTTETVEIERLMEKLSSQVTKIKGKLDTRNIHSLAALIMSLEKYKSVTTWTPEIRSELQQTWDDLFIKFDTLRQDSSDYLGIINSKNLDEAMQGKNILVFSKKFKDYLTSFIMTLIQNMSIIQTSVEEISLNSIDKIVCELAKSQMDRPILGEEMTEEDYAEIFENQWISMKKWFIPDGSDERYIDYLYKQTDETISRFVKYVQQLSERDQQIQNRKKELEHIAKLFEREVDIEKCHQCFGAMTNVEKPLHFYTAKERKVDSNKKLMEHLPESCSLKDAKDTPKKERSQLASFEVSDEDRMQLELLEARKLEEATEIFALVQMGSVKVRDLTEVKPHVRQTLLGWISSCNGKELMTGKTEHGFRYRINKISSDLVRLACIDGQLEMPDYQIDFEVGK